jgi:hypothetical protein
MQGAAAGLAEEVPENLCSKRTGQEIPSSADRSRVWRTSGSKLPELHCGDASLAMRLLSARATSAAIATERNWLLWGRFYCCARSSLGMERAKALLAICAAERAKMDLTNVFELTLSVLEGATYFLGCLKDPFYPNLQC